MGVGIEQAPPHLSGARLIDADQIPSEDSRQTKQMDAAGGQKSVVFVVDDDPAMQDSLKFLFQSVGLDTLVFASASDFLQTELPHVPSCLVVDVRLPGLSGLQLQTELAKANNRIPVIFMTGHGDIRMAATAMKAGAVEFFQKPFRDQDMLDAVRLAIEQDCARRKTEKLIHDTQVRFATLTSREREVMGCVVAGRLNKQIAHELGVTEVTVKLHRGSVMQKMGAKSLPDLVTKAALLLGSSRPIRSEFERGHVFAAS
jgi:FixJ family two-component response regulator